MRTTFFSHVVFFSTVSCEPLKLHSHQTADQTPTNADQFLWLGRYDRVKKLPALIEERIRGLSKKFVDNRHLTFFNENKELKPISRYTSINMRGLSGK